MTDLQPGWIPNPSDPHEVQYWDGTAWTGAYQRWNGTEWVAASAPVAAAAPAPSVAVPAESAPPRKRRKLGLVIGLTAGGLVALLIGVIAIVNVTRGNGDVTALSSWSIARTDERAGLDYTAPALGLKDRNQEFLFKTNFDPYDVPAWATEEGKDDENWALKVFANKELTIEVPTGMVPSYKNGRGFTVLSHETRYAAPYDADNDKPTVIRDNLPVDSEGKVVDEDVNVSALGSGAYTAGGWGLYDDYFMVRYIDADGAKLERPVVSEFSFTSELSTPSATIVADDTTAGAVRFSWDPVPGADHYVVLKSYADGRALEIWEGDLVSRDYLALAETTDTTWSTASQTVSRYGNPLRAEGDPYLSTQNEAMEMFSVSEDRFIGDPLDQPLNHSQVEFGVVAVAADGTTSAFGRASVASEVASLPYELAENALNAIAQCEGALYHSRCASADQLITYVPYVGLDGAVRATPARMDEEPWLVDGSRYIAAIVGEGTDVGYWAEFPAGSLDAFHAAAAAFNERSRLAAPQTGLVETQLAGLTTVAEPVSKYSDAAGKAANGSNDLVKYIAAHLIDGHEAIDVSEWADWGSENIRDAVGEAYWQNPIAGVDGYDYDPTKDLVIVDYEADREKRVADTVAAVKSITGQIITAGMSDAEKVTAINSYIVDNVEYDYPASDSVFISVVPEEYKYAWTLSGALLDGSVVCVGYAQAFKALADAAGLESVVVTGAVVSSAVGHAWNKVKVDGQWTVVDPTWDDGGDPSEYLMISDSFFTGDQARTYDTDWMYDIYVDTYATK